MKLSVGQKQRVCLIRTLLMGPEIMLLDEPTSALDRESASIVLERALAVNREKRLTILMVTHGNEDLVHAATSVLEIEKRKVVRL
jgi:putative ABC transport system ATP-binding protein